MTRRIKRLALTMVWAIAVAYPHAQSIRTGAPAPPPSPSSVPRLVPFSGQVREPNGATRTGPVLLTFVLYAEQQGGAPIWSEQQLLTLDTDGRYSVILGSASPDGVSAEAFAAGTPRWLGVQVEGEPEQPRFMLLSVPYALKAGDADTIAGAAVTEFVRATELSDSVKASLKDAGYAPKPANPTVTDGVVPKYIGGSPVDSIISENIGRIGVNNPTNLWHAYQTLRLDNNAFQGSAFTLAATTAGGKYYSLVATGPAASTGAGYLAVYDEGAGQYRLAIDPAGNIGIGTTTAGSKLVVNAGGSGGQFNIGTPGGESGMGIIGSNRADVRFDGSTLKLLAGLGPGAMPTTNGIAINTAGNVGVGTTAPAARMALVGGPSWTSNLWQGSLSLQNAAAIGWGANAAGNHFGIGQSTGGLYFFRTTSGLGTTGSPATYDLELTDSGDVVVSNNLSVSNGIQVLGGNLGVSDGSLNVLGGGNFGGAIFFALAGIGGDQDLCRNSSNRGIVQCSSSLRYKDDTRPYVGGLDIVSRLRPISFTWKQSGVRDVGFGAEDVEQVEPLLTFRNQQDEVEGVKYKQITTVLVNAVNEQQRIIEDQQVQIHALTKLVCSANAEAAICRQQSSETTSRRGRVGPTAER